MTVDLARLAAELERDEGLRLKPYRCSAGKLTIGVGRNLDQLGISEDEAAVLLANDIARVAREIAALPAWIAVKDDPVRARVLLNMAFNLGLPALVGFRNTLAAVARKDWAAATAGMRKSRWAAQVGPRAERPALMMETGKEPG